MTGGSTRQSERPTPRAVPTAPADPFVDLTPPDDPGYATALPAVDQISGVAGSWCPAISPDGTRLAYVTDRSGLPRLEIAPLSIRPGPGRLVSLPDQEVVSVAWSPDGAWLAYLVSPSGLIRSELHAIRPDGSDHRVLAGTGEWETVFAGGWTGRPHTYAFSLADGRGPNADICLVDVVTGEIRRVLDGGFLALTSMSGDGRRLLARTGPRGHRHLLLADLDSPFGGFDDLTAGADRELARRATARDATEGAGPTVVLDVTAGTRARRLLAADFPDCDGDVSEDGRFAPDGRSAHLRVLGGRERWALGRVDLFPDGSVGPLRVVAARADADLDSYAVSARASAGAIDDPVQNVDIATLFWNVGGASVLERRALPRAGNHDEPIAAATVGAPGDLVDLGAKVVPGWSLLGNGRAAILEVTAPTSPRRLHHLHLLAPGRTRGLVPVPSPVAGPPEPVLPEGLVEPRSVTYPAADGGSVQAWLYRPDGAAGPGAAVVLLHGGPESQERPAFSILAQSLCAVGLTVIAPNVRGSSGFGRSFMAADDLDRRETSFQDVPATVDYLVGAGLAAPHRIGVHGWSYGGYLALIALTRWPGLFACGSSHAGMSHLAGFFAETETWMAAASVTEYGDPRTDPAMLSALSPLVRFTADMAPTLLLHGEQDTNVPVGESRRAYERLLAVGATASMLLLPGQGHTIVERDARIALTRGVTSWHHRWTR
ncbi:alpha/beta hydrolase family protein [Nakamurella flava]|uniref:alpha/beta hydrolase family protein n=1 Tax=Nakamurella flava TaxID=2576308 RepID=UPI00140B7598|nr:prolyl oligopeptidase family serine peptidase [Nakamurella flava]